MLHIVLYSSNKRKQNAIIATILDLCQHVMKEREKQKKKRKSFIKMLKHLISANYSRCGVVPYNA